ncbi:MAG TPA: FeoA family protein [bacterium]|mgnify:CR=1 FL=1|nr:FeoA family protein [bacterium]
MEKPHAPKFHLHFHSRRFAGGCGDGRRREPGDALVRYHQFPTMPEIPLCLVRPGESVRISAIHGGREMKQRLASLGLNPGLDIEVLQNTFGGPVTVRSKDVRIAIGHGMAHKIFVQSVC